MIILCVYIRKFGRSATLNAGACLRAILSFLEDSEIEDIMKNSDFKKYTDSTVVDNNKLWKMIKDARKNGFTISYGEIKKHTVAIGVPIFNHNKKVIASISIAGPEQRFKKEKLDYFVKKLLKLLKKYLRL